MELGWATPTRRGTVTSIFPSYGSGGGGGIYVKIDGVLADMSPTGGAIDRTVDK